MDIYIDIVDSCNLRCPTCARGRGDLPSSSKQMTPETLAAILSKANKETHLENIHLYNATEPTLHHDLPQMIRLAGHYGKVWISTNASHGVFWKNILEAEPHSIGISVSGSTQSIHEKGHVGSDLSNVKFAIIELGYLKRVLKSQTNLQLYYHRYRYNLQDEKPICDLAKQNGFKVFSAWAIMMDQTPMENTAECIGDNKQLRSFLQRYPVSRCWTLENILSIDCNGDVYLCGHGPTISKLAPFLSTSLADIQALRKQHPFCHECMSSGFAHYGDRDELMKYAFSKQAGFTAKYLGEFIRNWIWSRLRWFKRA